MPFATLDQVPSDYRQLVDQLINHESSEGGSRVLAEIVSPL